MPIDTVQKRQSARNMRSPWRGCLPIPSGTVTLADRQQVGAWAYSGVLASTAVIVAGPFLFSSKQAIPTGYKSTQAPEPGWADTQAPVPGWKSTQVQA